MFDTLLDTDYWLSALWRYKPRIVTLSACVYMNRIRNFHFKFATVVVTKKTNCVFHYILMMSDTPVDTDYCLSPLCWAL